jgi:hypothetical protein
MRQQADVTTAQRHVTRWQRARCKRCLGGEGLRITRVFLGGGRGSRVSAIRADHHATRIVCAPWRWRWRRGARRLSHGADASAVVPIRASHIVTSVTSTAYRRRRWRLRRRRRRWRRRRSVEGRARVATHVKGARDVHRKQNTAHVFVFLGACQRAWVATAAAAATVMAAGAAAAAARAAARARAAAKAKAAAAARAAAAAVAAFVRTPRQAHTPPRSTKARRLCAPAAGGRGFVVAASSSGLPVGRATAT